MIALLPNPTGVDRCPGLIGRFHALDDHIAGNQLGQCHEVPQHVMFPNTNRTSLQEEAVNFYNIGIEGQ